MTRPREVKVFEISVRKDESPIPFELEFSKEDGKTETHEFHALADPGAGAALALASIVRYDDRGKQIIDLNGMLTYFQRVLVSGDFERLSAVIDRDDLRIPMATVSDVFTWLLEEHTGRPTKPSSSSSAGPRKIGGRSTAAALSRA